MFRLESNRLKREFKIANGTFYASQIQNKYSNMSFVPDGNGCEFVVFFTDGSEVSSKGLAVVSSSEENEKLKFVFAQSNGITVTLEYWIHEDGNTICKQLTLDQSDDKIVDRVFLENIGIVNSKTHFGIDPKTHKTGRDYILSLGQPFYIDSLFFGCENPAADSKIIHGAGQIRYYLGKNVGRNFKCPVTFMGGGKDNTIGEVKKVFFEFIDFISVPTQLRLQHKNYTSPANKKAYHDLVCRDIDSALKSLNAPDMTRIFDAVLAGGAWNDYKADFWSYNKFFPNGLKNIKAVCNDNKTGFGLEIDPDGYFFMKETKFAKKIQRASNGFVNSNAKEICTASARYMDKFTQFVLDAVNDYDLSYISFGSFGTAICTDESHDHLSGGKNDMYYITDMWEKRIELLRKIRAAKEDIWINFSMPDTLSPWWLQLINSMDFTGVSDYDIQSLDDDYDYDADAEITLSDAMVYDCICKNAAQISLAKSTLSFYPAKFSDEEFSKYILWLMVRGQELCTLDFNMSDFTDYKRTALSRALRFREENAHILKNASFIGGNPIDYNIYGYVSWTEDGEGIIALRNPTDEKTALTLTLNKLMGVPEDFKDARRENIFSLSVPETEQTFSYNEKIDLTLHPFETIIFKFTK